MVKGLFPTVCAAMVLALPAYGQSSRITQDMADFETSMNGHALRIQRNGAACPPSCVQPMQAASGVVTVAELEVLDFLDLFVSSGQGLLVDVRFPDGFASGTVPGAVNVPEATLRSDNPYREDLLSALGVRSGDFSSAFDLVILGGGPDDAQAPEAVRALLEAGYPETKLKYYRGGVAAWRGLGLDLATGQ
ncbi:rhodanese-related sulfurtransferase [Sagittula marina]|uniref:Rhodanese-related sulfurtransferase n=1 Tax=Sagittula marina TaxID=943940 RepID=A0A7W6DNC8_9RHOB|nr:rhodanese-like domain-containing protein [Sagittula marina]MBB3983922.1 rhodanese-related sulfurtransferase [Sagittula marina]